MEEIARTFAGRANGELRREDFTPERIAAYAQAAAQAGLNHAFLSQEEREANRARFLAPHPPDTDLWLFGYGSLMWNPAIETAEQCPARIEGYSRAFSLTLVFGRATFARPGLMLTLADGGDCAGVAWRIAADKAAGETQILWMREMLSGAYRPVWLALHFPDGRTERGFTFAAQNGHPRIETGLDADAAARRIAAAEGERGTNRDYLFACKRALDERGLRDPYIDDLCARVRALLSVPPQSPGRTAT
jgi:cation transport protein ChaC